MGLKEIKDKRSSVNVVSAKPTEKTVEENPSENVVEEKQEEDGFKISGGFKFSRFEDNDTKESKFGPLKFGDGYDLNDDAKK